MIAEPAVAVVILNWNGKAYLERFLPSVVAGTYPNMQIVVGDNASADDSVLFLTEHYPQVRIIRNDQNYGFAEGYNRVLQEVEAEYFILLNSDVEVTPGWIGPVIRMMQADATIAAAQPKLLSYHNKHQFEYAGAAGGCIDQYGYPFCRGRIFDTIENDEGQYNLPSEIFWASGAALFIRRSCWQETGGLDAGFFAHMEEIDLCWRLKHRGYKIMYCPGATVFHLGGGTLNAEHPQKTYLNFRNNLVMLQKNLPEGRRGWIIFIRFWLDLLALLKYAAAGKFQNAAAISRAHVHFLRDYSKNKRKAIEDTSRFNKTGVFNGSVVWEYYVKGKKRFGELGDMMQAMSS